MIGPAVTHSVKQLSTCLNCLQQLTIIGSGRVHMFTMNRFYIRKAGHISRCTVSRKERDSKYKLRRTVTDLSSGTERYMLNKVLYEVQGAMSVMNAITGSVTAKELR